MMMMQIFGIKLILNGKVINYYFLLWAPKGQLIPESNFSVFKSPIKRTFFLQISALASKMGQIKKDNLLY